MQDARDSLIVALDVPDQTAAKRIVQQLGDSVSFYKVGKELFTAAGPAIVRELVSSGKRVFLDLKFHDIPNTVASAVRSAAQLGVSLLTVHASGGTKMLKAAADAARESESKPVVLAITVLTSMDQDALLEIGVQGSVQSQVLRLAGLAINAGCGGIVASAQEAAHLRQALGSGFVLVTPGIRPAGADPGDQARIVTPADALRQGANYLVVGRPITQASDPLRAAQEITAQMASAWQQ